VPNVITNIERKKTLTGAVNNIFIHTVMMYKCGGAAVTRIRITRVVDSQSMKAKKMMTMMKSTKRVVFISNPNT